MPALRVTIVRFVDGYQPGIVECEFCDAEGLQHSLIEKVPIVTAADLDAGSTYPQPGAVRCQVVSRWQEDSGRRLVRISTAKPDGVESAQMLSEFVVLESQLTP